MVFPELTFIQLVLRMLSLALTCLVLAALLATALIASIMIQNVMLSLITLTIVLLIVLLLVEVLVLLLVGCRLPPLSFALNMSPLHGEFDLSAMPQHSSVPSHLAKYFDRVQVKDEEWWRANAAGEGGIAVAIKNTCELMISYTTTSAASNIPCDLQGVFWMEGNAAPEEIACLNYSSWNDDTLTLTKVSGPFDWTFLDSDTGKSYASVAKLFNSALCCKRRRGASHLQAFKFDDHALSNGCIWECRSPDYADLNFLSSIGEFSMERLEGPGVNFKRGCYWFNRVFGHRIEYGSYRLRKIMHTDIVPVQPAYDEFVEYMSKRNSGLSLILHPPSPNA